MQMYIHTYTNRCIYTYSQYHAYTHYAHINILMYNKNTSTNTLTCINTY